MHVYQNELVGNPKAHTCHVWYNRQKAQYVASLTHETGAPIGEFYVGSKEPSKRMLVDLFGVTEITGYVRE
jgi:hypothetical protein